MLRFLHMFTIVIGLIVLAGCGPRQGEYKTVLPTDPNHIAAQEVRLKVRELADQLLASLPNDALTGLVALPASFVDQNNFNSSSPLGRYLAEGLIYEFNQRGFPVRDYRTDGSIAMREGMGEAALARKGTVFTAKARGNALLVGTYHQDPDVIFVNARLVRSSDGIVLRTGQVMLTPNAVTLRMANAGPDGLPLGTRNERRRNAGDMVYPEPGGVSPTDGGPLFAHASASKSSYSGMKVRQKPPRGTRAAASSAAGLMGYVPE